MTSVVSQMTARPQELLRAVRLDSYARAKEDGCQTLTEWLERANPTAGYAQHEPEARVDAFQRVLAVAGIRTNSVPEASIYADRMDIWSRNESNRALFPEWVDRQVRKSSHTLHTALTETPAPQQRTAFMSDYAPGSIMQPYSDNPNVVYQQIAPAIPLASIMAREQPIDGDAYRSFYLVDQVTDRRMSRVAETAEIPETKFVGAEHVVRVYKFGRALRASYEALRRMRIDLMALAIQRITIQSEIDKLAVAIDTLVNGDGNTGTAAIVYALTALDPAATPGTVTVKAWLAFKNRFYPYVMNTVLAQEAQIINLSILQLGNNNFPFAVINANGDLGGLTPITNRFGGMERYGLCPDVPASRIIGFDSRLAIQHLLERGSDIMESTNWITNQSRVFTISFNDGFATLDQNAVRLMRVDA